MHNRAGTMNDARSQASVAVFLTEENSFSLLSCADEKPDHTDNSFPLDNCVTSTSLIKSAAINGPTSGIINK